MLVENNQVRWLNVCVLTFPYDIKTRSFVYFASVDSSASVLIHIVRFEVFFCAKCIVVLIHYRKSKRIIEVHLVKVALIDTEANLPICLLCKEYQSG